MADELNPERLRRLAELRPERGRVLSVFLNLDPSQFGTAPARASAITSIVNEAAQRVEESGADHDDLVALREDVERVREALQGDGVADDAARAVAVFACGPAELLEILRLPKPIDSRAVVDDSPYVEPLVTEVQGARWCLVLANRRSARIFFGPPDQLEETDRIEDNVHSQHQQGGWSQARYERSVDKDVQTHLGHTAEVLFNHYKRHGFDHLLVGGPEETLGDLKGALHSYLQQRIVGDVQLDVENSGIDDVRTAAAEAVEAYETQREREALDRLNEAVGRGGRGAAGLDEVLSALNEARVEILLLADGFTASGYRDRESGLLTSEDRSGPVDEGALEHLDNLVEAAIEKTMEQAAEVMLVRRHDDLERHGGIGAVLRY
jgi:peptide subunit release factor 1 (eRF1)